MSAVQLRNDFRDVLELGHSWGMSESEIQNCLRVVIDKHSSNNSDVSKNPGSLPRSATQQQPFTYLCESLKLILYWLKNIFWGLVVAVVLLVVLYNAILLCCFLSPTFENRFGKVTAPLTYPAMRLARIALKPLADTFGVLDVYSSECLVDNPFFVDPIDDCEPCENKFHIIDLTGASAIKMIENVEELNPFVVRSFTTLKIDLTALQEMYYENEKRFIAGGTRMFHSNLDNVHNITDFFKNYNHEDLMNLRRGTGYVAWHTNSVPSSQAIRKLSPRPEFVLEQSEISLLKGIYIEGPFSGDHLLPIGGFVNSWYLQAHGKRQITLLPHPDCTGNCNEMEIVLKAGDLVSFQDQFWRLESSPVVGQHTEAISIAFTSSFAI